MLRMCGHKTFYVAVLIQILVFFLPVGSGLGCDPNENCNRCLVSNPFGGCTIRGNDPVCEARKATCQVGGGAITGAIFTGPLQQGGIVPQETIQKCLSRPGDCAKEVIARGGYAFIRPVVDEYISDLRRQASGKYSKIPFGLQRQLSSYFDFNLNDVRFAFNINTRHGQHITIGNEIYFTFYVDFSSCFGYQLLAHELEHVGQYGRRGGIDPFIAEYVLKSVGKVLETRSFNVHDNVDIERAAISKAGSVGCPASLQRQPTPTPPLGIACLTPYGACPMNGAYPINAPCICGSMNGPIQGVVR